MAQLVNVTKVFKLKIKLQSMILIIMIINEEQLCKAQHSMFSTSAIPALAILFSEPKRLYGTN